MPAKLGSIMHLNKPFSSAPLMDIQLNELSNRAIKNSALTTKLKGIVGVEIGPVTVAAGQTNYTLRIPASGTNSAIHTDSEVHLITDNGAGSSNTDAQTYDTPIWHSAKTIYEGYIAYTLPSVPVITDFYLRVINDSL